MTRSPTSVGRGSCTSGAAVIIDASRGEAASGRSTGSRPPTRSTIAAMCSGVVPQQPPTIPTPKRSTNSCSTFASGSGFSGKIVSPSGPWWGMPAFGMQWIG